jgi:hypothetical protein
LSVGEERILDHHAAAPARLEALDEVLEKEKGRLAGANGKVLLHFFPLFAAEGRIGQHDVVAILLLNVGEVFGKRVGVDDVRRLDAVQDHVHDRDHVGERLLLFPIESLFLQRLEILCREVALGGQIVERFAEEARRSAGAVIDALADLRFHHLDHRADQRARGVVFAAVAPGVAHVLDLGFIEVRELVLLGLRTEAQFVDVVDDLAQVVAALDLVLDLAEDFPDLVLDGIRPAGLLLETMQIRKQLESDEVAEITRPSSPCCDRVCRLYLSVRPSFPIGSLCPG